LVKIFCAILMAMAPPRELKKMAMALPVGMSKKKSASVHSSFHGKVRCLLRSRRLGRR
jgi:hypothetical protein